MGEIESDKRQSAHAIKSAARVFCRAVACGDRPAIYVEFRDCHMHCSLCAIRDVVDDETAYTLYTPDRLYHELRTDDRFKATDRNVTFTGGEPARHSDFISRFKELCGPGLKIRIETSLNVGLSHVVALARVADEWVVDVKTVDSDVYRRYTGSEFWRVKANLAYLVREGGIHNERIVLRIPVLEGFTDKDSCRIAQSYFADRGFTRFEIVDPSAGDGRTEAVENEPIRPGAVVRRRVLSCHVAGLSYRLGRVEEVAGRLNSGAAISLVRDYYNKYDEKAVAVCLKEDVSEDEAVFDFSRILGYVPRTVNSKIAELLDNDEEVTAEVECYCAEKPVHERLEINIYCYEDARRGLLRAQSLDDSGYRQFIKELRTRGSSYFRWGGFPFEQRSMPRKGDKIIVLHRRGTSVELHLMFVMAVGNDCAAFVEDSQSLVCVDDCQPFILTHISGPMVVGVNDLLFADGCRIDDFYGSEYLSPEVSDGFSRLFDRAIE